MQDPLITKAGKRVHLAWAPAPRHWKSIWGSSLALLNTDPWQSDNEASKHDDHFAVFEKPAAGNDVWG